MSQKKQTKRRREVPIYFFVNLEERELLSQRMAESGIETLSAYLRRIALEGKITRVNAPEIRSLSVLLGNIASNVNQIARRANQTGSIYASDLDELGKRYQELHSEFIKLQNIISSL